jgi:predicted permease
MFRLRRLFLRLHNVLRPGEAEPELAREVASHLALLEDDFLRQGMTPDDARVAARRALGGAEHAKDLHRDARSFVWLDDLRRDLQYALRTLRRAPAFTAVAIVTLALGIGANTAIFALFDAVLLQTLPVHEPERLVLFTTSASEGTSTGDLPRGRWTLFSVEVYEFLRTQPLPYASLAAVRSGQATVSFRMAGDPRHAERVERGRVHLVSGNYFAAMGVDAAIGRTLHTDDDRPAAPPAAVVSHDFWKQRLDSDVSVVGKTAVLNGTAFTIVGVAPPEFFGERVRHAPDFWTPLVFQPQIELRPSYVDRSDAYWLNLVGRLAIGATPAQAQAATTVALKQFLEDKAGAKAEPGQLREIQEARVELVDGAGGISGLRQLYSAPLHVLLAVVGLVLLVACANVGNLLLSRGFSRRGEIALRVALGASRARLTRQLFTESLLLAVLGAGCGVLLAKWAANALVVLVVAKGTPLHATLNGPVLAFTAGVTLLASLVFGLAPALAAQRADLVTGLTAGSRSVTSGRRGLSAAQTLVVAQIALSLVLLTGASLFARSLINLERQPLGFDEDHVLIARINPRLAGYTAANVTAMYRTIYDRIRTLPGVRSATLARYSPLGGGNSVHAATVEGYVPRPGESVSLEVILVGPSYPETLGMPLRQGRSIGIQDGPGTPKVGMVNESFVGHFFAGQNPIGRHFGVSGSPGPADIEIVGVLKDAQFQDSKEPVHPVVFVAMLQDASQFALDCEIEVRTAGDPAAASNELRSAIAEVDRDLPVSDSITLREQVASTFRSQRLAAQFVSAFSGLALLLACVGLYGMAAQAVARRTGEIGLRLALGAQRGDVLRMILREAMVVVLVGLVVGVAAAFGAGRVVASQLYGLGPGDPLSLAFAGCVMSLVAAIASLVPAQRATRIDPLVALRCD